MAGFFRNALLREEGSPFRAPHHWRDSMNNEHFDEDFSTEEALYRAELFLALEELDVELAMERFTR